MFYGYDFPEYVTVAERRRRSEREAKALRKKDPRVSPVVIEGRKIARTFWGEAWCRHIESLRDYESRLPRGRSYVRNGAVVDLRISEGRVAAKVSGTALYTVDVRMTRVGPKRRQELVDACAGQIASVVELLAGKLSSGVMEILCSEKQGVFPLSREIELSCSCPDGAWLCKHLAAVLYGVGARLDEHPELLFVLRGIDQVELVGAASANVVSSAASPAHVLADDAVADVFGIELEAAPPEPKRPAPRKRTASVKPKARKARRRRRG